MTVFNHFLNSFSSIKATTHWHISFGIHHLDRHVLNLSVSNLNSLVITFNILYVAKVSSSFISCVVIWFHFDKLAHLRLVNGWTNLFSFLNHTWLFFILIGKLCNLSNCITTLVFIMLSVVWLCVVTLLWCTKIINVSGVLSCSKYF